MNMGPVWAQKRCERAWWDAKAGTYVKCLNFEYAPRHTVRSTGREEESFWLKVFEHNF